ncbi:MAG TPA: TetR/AcrR family transcriptional regulator [Phototrophicaceae bacterium]|nr:TetR/AcrR family transcriptional regulator [Phototrophicaceae bacterium]
MPEESQSQPGKRTRLSGEERRALMLRRAKHVFARSSYAEASTGELARESDVTEPMLYKHFGSKKGLFLAVLNESGIDILNRLQNQLSARAEKDIVDALNHIVADYRDVTRADPDSLRLLFQAVAASSDPDIRHCISEHNRRVYAVIYQLVERTRKEDYLDPSVSTEAVAWGYMSTILTMQYASMLDLSNEIMQVQPELSRIWLRGLLP